MKILSAAITLVFLLMGTFSCDQNSTLTSISTALASVEVYFTDPLAGLPTMKNVSVQANQIPRALIKLIDSAQRTLDIAIYSFSYESIAEALERACRRDVRVRLIVESENRERSSSLNSLSCVTTKLDRNSDLMHEKFLIADEASVWIGSLNWTCLDLHTDANNALLIHHILIAAALKAEFEGMWEEHFGTGKHTREKKHFEIAGHSVDLYFLPLRQARDELIQHINGARSSIYIAMYAFTDDAVSHALRHAQERGVKVQAIWDYQSQFVRGSEVWTMLNRDIGVLDANPGLVHHKFAVIDEKRVITGSANWSRAGFEQNDENLLMIENVAIARAYLSHWKKLYDDAWVYDREPSQAPRLHTRVFDRSGDKNHHAVRIEWRPHLVKAVDQYELCRALSSQAPCEVIFANLAPGVDYYLDTSAHPDRTYYYRLRGKFGDRWSEYSNEYSTNSQENCHE